MSKTKTKSKSPILFVLAAFAIIVALMVIANSREKLLKLLEPSPGGVESLYTSGNQLAVISGEQEIFIWDWNQLDSLPIKAKVNASKLHYLPPDSLIWASVNSPETVIISNLKSGEVNKRLSLGTGVICKFMNRSANGKFIVFATDQNSKSNQASGAVRFSIFDPAFDDRISTIFTIDLEKDKSAINEIAVTDEGDRLVIVGTKNEKGWVGAVDVNDKKLLWQREFETTEIREVVFSPDGRSLYCGGAGRVLYQLETETGKTRHEYQMEKAEFDNKKQYIACITVTDNGKYIAACTGPSNLIYIWDAKTNELIEKIGAGEKTTQGGVVINTLAFSPENDMIAAGDITAIRQIKIFKSSKTK